MKLNKRFGLALTAILCAIAICAAMIPAMSVFADEEFDWTEAAAPIEGITATCTDPFHVDGFWHIDYLFDSMDSYMGWHGSADGTNIPSEETPTVITADLKGYYDVYFIVLYPMDHTGIYEGTPSLMPSAFTLELSTDNGETWIEVATESEVYCTLEDEPLFYILPDLGVEPVMGATNFRMTITAPGANDLYPNAHCTGIGNIEIFGIEAEAPETTAPETVTETETVVETVVESEEIESEEIESEEIESEEIESEEIESEEIESEEIESEVESENEEIESEVESAEETVVETTVETKGETTVETKGETTAETKGETAAPETDAPAADDGCASVVGMGAVAVLTAAAAAVVLKKKD